MLTFNDITDIGDQFVLEFVMPHFLLPSGYHSYVSLMATLMVCGLIFTTFSTLIYCKSVFQSWLKYFISESRKANLCLSSYFST